MSDVALRGRSSGRRTTLLALVIALFSTLLLVSSPPTEAIETTGTDFWIAFNRNHTGNPELTIFISGSTATSGEVTPRGQASIPFTVTPGTVTSVPVPSSLMLSTNDGVEDKGIHVTAGAPVAVYGLNRIQHTTDAFLAIPTDAGNTSFRTLGYQNTIAAGGLGVVATADGTTVTITPRVTVGARTAGVPFDINLDAGQTYQLGASPDSSGSTITSNKPISVYGYSDCTNIPTSSVACDHIVEQLPPTSAWGTSFLAARLATRTKGDTYRVLADQDDTVVTIDGADVATLAAGEFYEGIHPGTAATAANEGVRITTTKPALVAQYSNGTSFDGVTSDPFMMLIPPFEQFQSSYTVTTPASGFSINFVNVVIPNSAVASFLFDGAALNADQFAPIADTGFSSAQIPVSLGSHTLSAAGNFGVFVYGFDSADSYGYPGGYNLSPIAAAANLTLNQPAYSAAVGSPICPVATITDGDGAPLAGITVTFVVDNPTAATETAVTNAQGQATVCFDSAVAGTGGLVATAGLAIGQLTASATVTWGDQPITTTTTTRVPPPVVTPRFAG